MSRREVSRGRIGRYFSKKRRKRKKLGANLALGLLVVRTNVSRAADKERKNWTAFFSTYNNNLSKLKLNDTLTEDIDVYSCCYKYRKISVLHRKLILTYPSNGNKDSFFLQKKKKKKWLQDGWEKRKRTKKVKKRRRRRRSVFKKMRERERERKREQRCNSTVVCVIGHSNTHYIYRIIH